MDGNRESCGGTAMKRNELERNRYEKIGVGSESGERNCW